MLAWESGELSRAQGRLNIQSSDCCTDVFSHNFCSIFPSDHCIPQMPKHSHLPLDHSHPTVASGCPVQIRWAVGRVGDSLAFTCSIVQPESASGFLTIPCSVTTRLEEVVREGHCPHLLLP